MLRKHVEAIDTWNLCPEESDNIIDLFYECQKAKLMYIERIDY